MPDLTAAAGRGADLVVATRYAGAGSAGGLSSRFRGLASRGADAAARVLFPRALADVSDPMSGFFAVRTAAVRPGDLRPRGFKILLELLVRTPTLRVAEVPFTFAERQHGQSKASGREAARYLRQLVALRLAAAGRAWRLARFAIVGGSGVLVNLAVLALLLRVTPSAIGGGGKRAHHRGRSRHPGRRGVELRAHRGMGVPRPARTLDGPAAGGCTALGAGAPLAGHDPAPPAPGVSRPPAPWRVGTRKTDLTTWGKRS